MTRVHSTYTTKNGTELELIDLKGKAYMIVANRLIWFIEENPFYTIETTFASLTENSAVAKATIVLLDAEGKRFIRKVDAYKSECKENFDDFAEKATTGAIGRALALLGYGTQFALADLDEGERIVDAPLQPVSKKVTNEDVKAALEEKPVSDPVSFESKRREREKKERDF
jgi:hypothetical protein